MEGETTAAAAAVEPVVAAPASIDQATPDVKTEDESAAITAESKDAHDPTVKEEEVGVNQEAESKEEEKPVKEQVEEPATKTDAAKEEVEATTKPKKEKKATPPPPARTSTREQRVRKSVDAYDPTISEEKKEFIIPNGKGEKLEDMPRVVANFKNVTWSDPHLKMLHTIAFGQGKKKEFKAHLLQFNGLVFPEGKEEEEREKVKQKMYKLVMGDLKEVMDLCDIDRSGANDKETMCDRFLEWLENPKSSGKKVKAASAAKKAAPAAKESSAAKTDSAKKRGRPKGSTNKNGSAKKAKSTATAKVVEEGDEIKFNIPGTTIEKVREKVKSIVEGADREELTVKGVRKILEEWLDTDLSDHKDAVRSLVMEAM